MKETILLTDGYKLGHHRQYPEGTEMVYSNWTPRSCKYFPEAEEGAVVFGLQYLIKEYLIKQFNENFFNLPKEKAINEFYNRVNCYVGVDNVGTKHIEALYDLGYLPIEIKALPEGSVCPIRVPWMTIKNTLPEFYWITNYLETLISCILWMPSTSATKARLYKKELMRHAKLTKYPEDVPIDFSCHDFSMRGMGGVEAAIISGMAHLTSFSGTDTIPAIRALEEYYNADAKNELIAGSVPACYSEDTEILTNSGWKYFKDLTDDDLVAQYSENKEISFVKPTEIIADRYNGKLIHYVQNCRGSKIDLLVTPNHRMVKRSYRNDKLSLFEANIGLKKPTYTKSCMIVSSGYKKDKENQHLSALDKLKIAFQADGSKPSHGEDYTGERNGGYPIRFSFKKDRKMARLERLFTEAGVAFTKQKYENGYYSIWAVMPEEFRKDFSWVKLEALSSIEAYEFIQELQYWDGCAKHSSIVYSSTNKECVDTVQAIAALCGYRGNISSYQDKRKDCKRLPIWSIILTEKERTSINMHLEVTEENYRGMVYCVSVPSKMIVVRRNNIALICGNTEHSVMCAGGKEDEISTFKRLINDVYPNGIVSIVSDTWDFWQVIEDYLPRLKQDIMSRDGRVVIRPDSGDPVDIICGLRTNPHYNTKIKDGKYYVSYAPFDIETKYVEISKGQYYGAYWMLGETFGWNTTENGYKYPDTHIGLIYGDSITLERQKHIYSRLESVKCAACNLVLGVGSYSYQYASRDSLGYAVKATACIVNGEFREIFKQPKTDDGTKNSLKGLISVYKDENGTYYALDGVSIDAENGGELKTVFMDGNLLVDWSLKEIRERINETL